MGKKPVKEKELPPVSLADAQDMKEQRRKEQEAKLQATINRKNDIVDRNEGIQHLAVLTEAWKDQMHAKSDAAPCEYCEAKADTCNCHKEVAQAFMEYRFMNPLFE